MATTVAAARIRGFTNTKGDFTPLRTDISAGNSEV